MTPSTAFMFSTLSVLMVYTPMRTGDVTRDMSADSPGRLACALSDIEKHDVGVPVHAPMLQQKPPVSLYRYLNCEIPIILYMADFACVSVSREFVAKLVVIHDAPTSKNVEPTMHRDG